MAKHGGVKDNGDYFVINPLTRRITVPHTHKYIGTVGDHLSEQITFACPQIIDGHDISQCNHKYVTWINVQGDLGHDKLSVAQVEQGADGTVYLSWNVRNSLTVANGVVQFSVHFEDVDGVDINDDNFLDIDNSKISYRWSTASCKDCEILDSINGLIGAYEHMFVSEDTLIISDYTPVKDATVRLGSVAVGVITITSCSSLLIVFF